MNTEIFYIVSVSAASDHGKVIFPLTLSGLAQPSTEALTSQSIYRAVMNEVTRCYCTHYEIPQTDRQLVVLNYYVVQNNAPVKLGPLGIVS